MPILPRIILLLAAALTVGVGAGCSRVSFFYDNADWFAMRWSASLLDADSEQKAAWEPWFDNAVERHRGGLLDEVVTLLDALGRQLDEGTDSERLGCWLDAVDSSYRRHAELVVPVAVAVLSSIRPDQVEHLAGEFDQRNAEYADERLFDDPEAQQAARLERYVERVEDWVGDLDAAQQRLVARHVSAMPDITAEWLDYRRRQQQHLLGLLRSDAPAVELRSFLMSWWRDLADRPGALQAETDHLRDAFVAMLVDLDGTLDTGQRERATERLWDLRDGLAGARDDDRLPVRETVRLSCPGAGAVG